MLNMIKVYGGDKMKVFVSWSGELSKKIAQELKIYTLYYSIG
jgi:hypothetical protein